MLPTIHWHFARNNEDAADPKKTGDPSIDRA